MPELQLLRTVLLMLRANVARMRSDDAGFTLELVLLSVALAGAALVVGAVLVARITEQARSIPTTAPTP
jgi:hypothetical protein